MADATDLALGPDNIIYVVGKFYGEVYLDPTLPTGFSDPPMMPETVESTDTDTFLCRFDPSGNLEWYRHWGPVEYIQSRPGGAIPIMVDLDNEGNLFIFSSFYGSYDFDPSQGEWILTSGEAEAQYMSKFSPEGDLVDVHTWPDIALVDSFEILNSQSILIAGYLRKKEIQISEGAVSTVGLDHFAAKLDMQGAQEWILTWDKLAIREIRGDDVGNVYLRCWLSEAADVDPGPATDFRSPEGNGETLIIKIDAEGLLDWVRTIRNHDVDVVSDFEMVKDGGVYVAGYYVDYIDPGLPADAPLEAHQANQIFQAFLIKFNSEGELEWENTWGADYGVESYELRSIVCRGVVTHKNMVYVYGVFNDTVDFDPSSASLEITANDIGVRFVSCFNSSGELQWVSRLKIDWAVERNPYLEFIGEIAVTDDGDVYVVGEVGDDAFLTMIDGDSYL